MVFIFSTPKRVEELWAFYETLLSADSPSFLTQKNLWNQTKFGHFELVELIFFKKWDNPVLFFVYFRSFQTNIITIFTPSKCESLPITTRPGLPQVDFNFVNFFSFTTRPARHIYSIWTAIWARRTYTRSTRPTSETSHTSSTIAATQTSQYITSGSTVWLVSIVHALSFCHLDIFIVYWMLWKIKIVISMAF